MQAAPPPRDSWARGLGRWLGWEVSHRANPMWLTVARELYNFHYLRLVEIFTSVGSDPSLQPYLSLSPPPPLSPRCRRCPRPPLACGCGTCVPSYCLPAAGRPLMGWARPATGAATAVLLCPAAVAAPSCLLAAGHDPCLHTQLPLLLSSEKNIIFSDIILKCWNSLLTLVIFPKILNVVFLNIYLFLRKC